jgi:hypothetical protein
MKPTLFIVVFSLAAYGQKIETKAFDQTAVIRLQTALNHLTVIELAEPVTQVAAGSSAYKVDWRGNKVFIQELEPDTATNLFIWTASGRLNYELVGVLSVSDADFAIDQEPGANFLKASASPPPPAPAVDPAATRQAKLASDILFASRPILFAGTVKSERVHVVLKDAYRANDRVYVRYAIQNDGHTVYQPGAPAVFTLLGARTRSSLYSFAGSQITSDQIRVPPGGQTPAKVVNADLSNSIPSPIPPGGAAYGVAAFQPPNSGPAAAPTVFRFNFPANGTEEVTAFLVL